MIESLHVMIGESEVANGLRAVVGEGPGLLVLLLGLLGLLLHGEHREVGGGDDRAVLPLVILPLLELVVLVPVLGTHVLGHVGVVREHPFDGRVVSVLHQESAVGTPEST